jgi:hypothetical protein
VPFFQDDDKRRKNTKQFDKKYLLADFYPFIEAYCDENEAHPKNSLEDYVLGIKGFHRNNALLKH